MNRPKCVSHVGLAKWIRDGCDVRRDSPGMNCGLGHHEPGIPQTNIGTSEVTLGRRRVNLGRSGVYVDRDENEHPRSQLAIRLTGGKSRLNERRPRSRRLKRRRGHGAPVRSHRQSRALDVPGGRPRFEVRTSRLNRATGRSAEAQSAPIAPLYINRYGQRFTTNNPRWETKPYAARRAPVILAPQTVFLARPVVRQVVKKR